MKQNKHCFEVGFEIFLMISFSIAFSFMLSESVSAQGTESQTAVSTCVESRNGGICQQYLSQDCAGACNGDCVPTTLDNVAECKLGTCFDSAEGICSSGSPKQACETGGGQWFDDIMGNVAECSLGCCVLGSQTDFTTERECRKIGETSGINEVFKPEVNTEIGCNAIASSQVEGACIYNSNGQEECRRVTKTGCTSLSGQFHESLLCSAGELNTTCQKEADVKCVDGKDEIYWVDSCGNRENIYEGSLQSQKQHSWNNGRILAKSDSCSIGTSYNKLANQGTCGNCDYLVSSTRCGAKTADEKLNDASIDAVCKDISCIDSSGKKRENGESWCEYNGAFGVDNRTTGQIFSRAMSPPGSESFVKTCNQGKVETENCAPMRTQICVESKIPKQSGSGTKSYATCRANLANICLELNTETDKTKSLDECQKNPDCFVKEVSVPNSNFNFKVCAPKYPEGFDLETNPDGATAICGTASLTCNAARIKTFGGVKWINPGCLSEKFTQQMNDFCMSLGDCGASVNYNGDMGDNSGYGIRGAPVLGTQYLNEISKYSENPKGNFVDAGNGSAYLDALGILGTSGETGAVNFPESLADSSAFAAGNIGGGIAGISLLYFGSSLPLVSTKVTSLFGLKTSSFLSPWAGAVAGAVIGAAAVGLLVKYLGLGPGMPDWLTYTMMAAGAVGGGLAGYALANSLLTSSTYFTTGGIWGIAILGALAITLVFMRYVLGVGKVTTYSATFECHPWLPAVGGDRCNDCGKDGLPCTKYGCESLGSECKLLNEGTKLQMCAAIPEGINPPVISPREGILPEGLSYNDSSERGFSIVSSSTPDGCIPAFTPLPIGISFDKPARCTFEIPTGTYSESDILGFLNETGYSPEDFGLQNSFLGEVQTGESNFVSYNSGQPQPTLIPGMTEFYFGGNNLYLYNQTMIIPTPSLPSLGVSGFDPNKRADFELKIRCEDKAGHKTTADYVIKSCISPEKRIVPPKVIFKTPQGDYVNSNATEQNVSVYTDVPADCRWETGDVSYEGMGKTFQCANGDSDITANGFKCDSTFPVSSGNQTYYVRCKDQPWETDDSKRNVMSYSYNFSLIRSKPLKIVSISPNNENKSFGTEPASISVVVKTADGVDSGNAKCFYLMGNTYRQFANTFGSTSSQVFNQESSGDKKMFVRCEDSVGNVALGNSSFKVIIDNKAPIVTRIRLDEGGRSLVVFTDEASSCYYNNDRCEFDIHNQSESFQFTGNGKEHTTPFSRALNYYVSCSDVFDNWASSCNMTIKGVV